MRCLAKNVLLKLSVLFLSGLFSRIFAQTEGEKAIGLIASKDGLRALNARFAMKNNHYVNLAITAGIEEKNNFAIGLALQQYLNTTVCGSRACGRRSLISPYIEGGVRFRNNLKQEPHQIDVLAHIGGGMLLPFKITEFFAQTELYTPITRPMPQLDIAGGIRLRF